MTTGTDGNIEQHIEQHGPSTIVPGRTMIWTYQPKLIPEFTQAIDKVAEADPSNIQEVAASQLSIINSYYQSGLQQSQQSFRWSLIWGGIGLGFLMVAVGVLLFRQPAETAVASGIGGAIVEVFASTYLYLYKHASDQLAAFRASLESTQRFLLANSMSEMLQSEIKQTTRRGTYSSDGKFCYE